MLKLYKHINNTDVAVEVLKKFYVKEKQVYKLKLRWWRILGSEDKPLYCMNIIENFTITRDVWLNDWKLL